MCGIYGLLSSIIETPNKHKYIQSRGPDETKILTGVQNSIFYYFAFYRLAMNDVANGSQPFENDKYIIMVNGEIYNHKMLEETFKLTPKLKTKSDCECILYLCDILTPYEILQQLEGEFAICIFDKCTNTLYFARDKFGRKPLFYSTSLESKTDQFAAIAPETYLNNNDWKSRKEYCESCVYPDDNADNTDNAHDTSVNADNAHDTSVNADNAHDTSVNADNAHCTSVNANTIKYNNFDISSLYKSLEFDKKEQVVPAYLYTCSFNTNTLYVKKYYSLPQVNSNLNALDSSVLIYNALIEAVRVRVQQTERRVGFLLSGGFDSSLLLSIALKFKMINYKFDVFTFSFDENSSDIKSATTMVKFLKDTHGEDAFNWYKVIQPVANGLNAIPSVIKALETYDTTTIRASTPMYLISKYISENTDVKVLISGEGADELFGGYMYFKYSPNYEEFRKEVCKLLNELYLYDVLRADRTTAFHSLEVRTPFLDDNLVSVVLSSKFLRKEGLFTPNDLNIEVKTPEPNTKQLIRDVFSTDFSHNKEEFLPNDILHGKKEAFSDAVGFSWVDAVKYHADSYICTSLDINNIENHTLNTINYKPSAESMMFMDIFSNEFPNSWHLLPKLWLPNQQWVKTGNEPSARVLSKY